MYIHTYIYIYMYIVLCFGRFFSTNWIYIYIYIYIYEKIFWGGRRGSTITNYIYIYIYIYIYTNPMYNFIYLFAQDLWQQIFLHCKYEIKDSIQLTAVSSQFLDTHHPFFSFFSKHISGNAQNLSFAHTYLMLIDYLYLYSVENAVYIYIYI